MNTPATERNIWESVRKMRGSSGRMNYVLIAARSGVGLGATMHPPMFKEIGGKKYLVYAAHLRSAKLRPEEVEGIEFTNISEIAPPEKLADFWPAFEFTKNDTQRASGDLVAHFEGTAYMGEDGKAVFPDALTNGEAARAIVKKMMEIAAPGTIITPEDDLLALYIDRDNQAMASIQKQWDMAKEHIDAVQSSAGKVVSQGSILKAMKEAYEEKHGKPTNAAPSENESFVDDPDADDADDEAGDDEDEDDDN